MMKFLNLIFSNPKYKDLDVDKLKKREAILKKYGGEHVVSPKGGMRCIFKQKEQENKYYKEILKPYREKVQELKNKGLIK